MRKIEELNKLSKLLKKVSFTSTEAKEAGVHPSVLSYYVKKGILERIDRGVYRSATQAEEVDFRWEDLIQIISSIPSGVICLITALAIYEITEEIPREHWIAVPNSSKAPVRKMTRIVRMRNMELGLTTIKIGNQSIPIFDVERTIVDSFRYLDIEVAIKSLKMAIANPDIPRLDLIKLTNYAKKLRVNINPYLLTVTT